MQRTVLGKKIVLESSTGFTWALLIFGAAEFTRLLFHSFYFILAPTLAGLLFMWYLVSLIEGHTGWNKVIRFTFTCVGYLILIGTIFRTLIVINHPDMFLIKDIIVTIAFVVSCFVAFLLRQALYGTK